MPDGGSPLYSPYSPLLMFCDSEAMQGGGGKEYEEPDSAVLASWQHLKLEQILVHKGA